jgi:hypothetical protein
MRTTQDYDLDAARPLTLTYILAQARCVNGADWHDYERYKRMVKRLNLSELEYSHAIRLLCDALGL